jgi:hypothetical protein
MFPSVALQPLYCVSPCGRVSECWHAVGVAVGLAGVLVGIGMGVPVGVAVDVCVSGYANARYSGRRGGSADRDHGRYCRWIVFIMFNLMLVNTRNQVDIALLKFTDRLSRSYLCTTKNTVL